MDDDSLDRRGHEQGPPTMVMQSYKDMGQSGRRKMQLAGTMLMAISVIAGLVVPLVPGALVPIAYYILVGVIFLVGVGLFWPQYGVLVINMIPTAIAKILPAKKVVDAIRPDRRGEGR